MADDPIAFHSKLWIRSRTENAIIVVRQVLKVYKQLLLSSKQTFGEDQETLSKVVQNVRAKFKDNKEEKDPAKIEEVCAKRGQSKLSIES